MAMIMNEQSGVRVEQPSIGWSGKRVRTIAAALWAGICDGLAAFRRYRMIEATDTEMSELPDADLQCLGLSHRDLYTWAKQVSRD